VARQVAEEIPADKIVVWQQDDGLWRWRWFPAHGGGEEAEPLLASHGFESAEEAEESARSAYPQTTRVVIQHPPHSVVAEAGRTTLRGCGAVLATMVLAGLVAARRRALRRSGRLG
jgi:hypothetical protein